MVSPYKYIAEYLTFLKSKNYSLNTILTRDRSLKKFRKWLNARGMSVQDVIESDIVNFRLSMKMLKASTVSTHLSAVKVFYSWMKKNSYVMVDPCAGINPYYSKKDLPVVLSQEEISELFDSLPLCTPTSKRNRAMLELAYSSLLRREELVNLKLSDLDLRENTVRVFRKGSIEAVLPFGQIAKNAIVDYLHNERSAESVSPYIWLSINSGEKISYASVDSFFKQIKKDTGLTLSMHTLRRSGATHMLQNGANLAVLQEMLSHSSLKALKHYLCLCVKDFHNTLAKSEDLK